MSTAVLMACTLMSMPVISQSLFSAWLFMDTQSTIQNSGPGFYNMHTLYWWMYHIIHCNHWDSSATSLLIITTNGYGLLPCILHWQNSNGETFPRLCGMPRASHSMLLYCCSMLDKLLLTNANGHKVALSGTSSGLQFIPFLTCSNPVPRMTPDASVSRYRGLDMSKNLIHVSFCTIFLDLSYRLRYILFHDHLAFTDVSFCSGSQTPAVIGENLLM